jgi:hypothetical protein
MSEFQSLANKVDCQDKDRFGNAPNADGRDQISEESHWPADVA